MPQERVYNETLNNGIPLTLRFRSVKLFRISVKGDGSVEAVAPRALSRAAAMALANGRAEWVRSHREEILSRASRASQYVSGETAPLWGREYALRVETGKIGAVLRGDELVLSAPEGADLQLRRAALLSLYRSELERAIPPLVEKYAAALSVPAPQWSLRDMRTRWGSCTPARGTVRFALNLAAKPPLCLEYVVAHELRICASTATARTSTRLYAAFSQTSAGSRRCCVHKIDKVILNRPQSSAIAGASML